MSQIERLLTNEAKPTLSSSIVVTSLPPGMAIVLVILIYPHLFLLVLPMKLRKLHFSRSNVWFAVNPSHCLRSFWLCPTSCIPLRDESIPSTCLRYSYWNIKTMASWMILFCSQITTWQWAFCRNFIEGQVECIRTGSKSLNITYTGLPRVAKLRLPKRWSTHV
jgi:hypothetical protein